MAVVKEYSKLIIERNSFPGDKCKIRLSVDQAIMVVENISILKDFIYRGVDK